LGRAKARKGILKHFCPTFWPTAGSHHDSRTDAQTKGKPMQHLTSSGIIAMADVGHAASD